MGSVPGTTSILPSARVVTLTKGAPGEPDIRKFDLASVNDHITSALKALPPDKTVAAVAFMDLRGANIAIVGRLKTNLEWTVMMSKPWNGEFDASAAIRWSI